MPGTDRLTVIGDDQSGSIAWHVLAVGGYDFESATVAATAGFPEPASSEQWSLVTDQTNRQTPSPLAYFSIETAF